MIILDKEYVETKIKNCRELIENASSQEQKEIYQGYLDHWRKFDKNKIIILDPVIKSEETTVDIADQYADIFEIENAPKQAYYKRNGQWVRTKAFKEYLNKITQ